MKRDNSSTVTPATSMPRKVSPDQIGVRTANIVERACSSHTGFAQNELRWSCASCTASWASSVSGELVCGISPTLRRTRMLVPSG